jgi:Prealbumin-like fold domain
MKRAFETTFRLVLLIALIAAVMPGQAAAQLSGAIFTTTFDGTIVNGNTKYNSKCEVYLDGGPGPNAPVGAAGLPPGDYYFQVTEPSGKKLLSTDVVSNRRVTVNANGVISAWVGVGGPTHPTGIDNDHSADGAITVQLANTLCPADFQDTQNNGGVYKAWMTPVDAFVGDPSKVDSANNINGIFHGFVPRSSKTDNFKVGDKEPTFCIHILKTDTKGTPLPGWMMTIKDSLDVSNDVFTDANGTVEVCNLVQGTYLVTESLVFNGQAYQVVGLTVNGVEQTPASSVAVMWTKGKDEPFIVFRNEPVKKP